MDRCGLCAFAVRDRKEKLRCWEAPPRHSHTEEDDEEVFIKRGQAEVGEFDPACRVFKQRLNG